MIIRNKLLYFTFSLVILISCHVFNPSKRDKDVMNMQNRSIILEPVQIQGFAPDRQNLNYSVVNAVLADTILTIELNYLGGCSEHSFNLVFNGMYKKSLPRQADLYLLHESLGDTCKENKSISVSYNLSSIIGTGKQAVNFTLIGYPDKLKYGTVPKN